MLTTCAALLHICQPPAQLASTTSRRLCSTKRSPALSSGQNRLSPDGGFSPTRMPRRIRADTSSSAASNSSATGAPSSLISAPARPGPATSAPELASAFFALASTSRSRSTTCVSTTCAALPAEVLTMPMTNATTYSHVMDSWCIHHASGMLAAPSASVISPAMYTGSLRTRSSHTPDGSENSTKGSSSMVVSAPICVGVACSSTAAVSGSASIMICAPNELVSTEVHRRR